MRPGTVATVAVLVAAGVVDLATIARHNDSITACCRRHPLITAVVVGSFVLHVAQRPRQCQFLDPYVRIGTIAAHIAGKQVSAKGG